ncbi:hypothetical protein KIN20_029610 [Parelaphostrongylus tenuis]|uniref:Uncharacterized protein n=1 Tax=Parelaphostrongylus tenuis TaxID=148309 RepID=A0AAD5R2M2_PARTN|nr:hypothetical protein KIN20_029610 [Parelaphostrongylus tenuis]
MGDVALATLQLFQVLEEILTRLTRRKSPKPRFMTDSDILKCGRISRKMIILTNKAGHSSAPFMTLLPVSISAVFRCEVIPGVSTRTFTASGPSNLPVIAVYTGNEVIFTLFPYCN